MYDQSDPRSMLTPPAARGSKVATEFAAAEYAKFSQTEPQESGPEGRSWYARGQNFVVAYTEAKPGAVFARTEHPDEYVVLIPDARTSLHVSTPEDSATIPGYSLAVVPPGNSTVGVPTGGRIVRLFSTRSEDLAAKCSNAASYARAHPNIPPFAPWPEPAGGYRIRACSLDVPQQPGRFGRIFRCTTFMVNFLEPQKGPRDITKLSPHHHDDFEQCSLALDGAFTHHLRWPWTTNMNAWRQDEHELAARCSRKNIVVPAAGEYRPDRC